MSRYLLSPAAQIDLDEIWDYTAARWGTDQAERYVRTLLAACEALADKRLAGRPIDHVRPGYFKFAVASHFICYRFTPTGLLDVVRVLHGRMDLDERLT